MRSIDLCHFLKHIEVKLWNLMKKKKKNGRRRNEES